MKETRLKRGIIISALQSDCRQIAGYAGVTAQGMEFRAFSLVVLVLWTLPIVVLSLVILWALPLVVLCKAFSLLSYSAVNLVRVLSISPQAESLTYHNLGHRPRSGHHPRSGDHPRSGHRSRLCATHSKPTASRSVHYPDHGISSYQTIKTDIIPCCKK